MKGDIWFGGLGHQVVYFILWKMNFLNATEGGLVAHFHAPVRPENHEPFRRMKKKIIPFFFKGKNSIHSGQ